MPHPVQPNPLEHFLEWARINNYTTESNRWLSAFYCKTFPGRVVPLLTYLMDKHGNPSAPPSAVQAEDKAVQVIDRRRAAKEPAQSRGRSAGRH
jgi:hypothetical protein